MLEIFKALGDETRLRMVNLLRKGELCVCEIEAVLGVSQSNASRHLTKLKNSGIITFYKKSQWVYYKLDDNFLQLNSQLIGFLDENFASNQLFKKDIDSLLALKEKDMCCE